MKVQEIMRPGAVSVSPSSTIPAVARRMQELDLAAIPVCESGRLIGIVTDRDILRRGVAASRDTSTMLVRDVMSSAVAWCTLDDDVETAIRIMEEKRIHHLAVLNAQHHMVGLLNLGVVAQGLPPARCGELLRRISGHGPS
jgi:CBS domain-containing protein